MNGIREKASEAGLSIQKSVPDSALAEESAFQLAHSVDEFSEIVSKTIESNDPAHLAAGDRAGLRAGGQLGADAFDDRPSVGLSLVQQPGRRLRRRDHHYDGHHNAAVLLAHQGMN